MWCMGLLSLSLSNCTLHFHCRCDDHSLFLERLCSHLWSQCSRKTFMVHQTIVRWALYILLKFIKSLIRHLALAIGNVRHVRRFSWTLWSSHSEPPPQDVQHPLPSTRLHPVLAWYHQPRCPPTAHRPPCPHSPPTDPRPTYCLCTFQHQGKEGQASGGCRCWYQRGLGYTLNSGENPSSNSHWHCPKAWCPAAPHQTGLAFPIHTKCGTGTGSAPSW